MSEKDGGSAFPREDYQADSHLGQSGMTLRDYVAAKALNGILASGEACPWSEMVANSYRLADLMLQAREAK